MVGWVRDDRCRWAVVSWSKADGHSVMSRTENVVEFIETVMFYMCTASTCIKRRTHGVKRHRSLWSIGMRTAVMGLEACI